MYKKLLFAVLMTVSLCAYAGKTPVSTAESTGIVTPDIATGAFTTGLFAYDSNGDILVCNEPAASWDWSNRTCKVGKTNAFRKLADSVPKGRVFVGFRMINMSGYGTKVEVYYK